LWPFKSSILFLKQARGVDIALTRAGGDGRKGKGRRGGGSEEIKLYAMHINNLFVTHTFRASCNHVTLDQLRLKFKAVNPTYDATKLIPFKLFLDMVSSSPVDRVTTPVAWMFS